MANSDLEPILNRRRKHGSFQTDLLNTVLHTLSEAPPDHAEAAHLFYLEGLTIRQIAAQLGRPEGTIKRWLSHARSFVRRRLGLRQMRIERRKTMTSANTQTRHITPNVERYADIRTPVVKMMPRFAPGR